MTKTALAVLLAAATVPASATPMLDYCLPVAPKTCALTEKSTPDEFLACFDKVKLSEGSAADMKCAPELLHAKVHKACDPADIPGVCKGVKPGNDRVMTCLRKNRKKLSEPCGKALDSYDGFFKAPAKKRKGAAVSAVRC